jgi:transposase
VASDILRASGRAILAALAQGETGPAAPAALAKGRLRQKRPQLLAALAGGLSPVQRALLAVQLAQVQSLDRTIAMLDTLIGTLVAPHQPALERLRTIPGIDHRNGEVLLAEVGLDMTIFPSARHCAAWSGPCRGHDESAGKPIPTIAGGGSGFNAG